MPNQRQFDAPASVVVRVRVTMCQLRDLERVARDNCTTVSGVLRDAADEYVSDYRDHQPVFGSNRRTVRDD
jgi:hypothetical protein